MAKNYEYHERQFHQENRQVMQFADWLEKDVCAGGVDILDMACGAGAKTLYMGQRFPQKQFTGMDYDADILKLCPEKRENVRLVQGDWYNIDRKYIGAFEGIVSFQALSWLSDYKEPLEKLCDLEPEWIALTSLFYEGRINFYTRIDDHEQAFDGWGKDGGSYWNIYSLPLVRELFSNRGYKRFEYKRFVIDIDLPKPDMYAMRSYTIQTKEEGRIEVSGALLQPWYFVFAAKE